MDETSAENSCKPTSDSSSESERKLNPTNTPYSESVSSSTLETIVLKNKHSEKPEKIIETNCEKVNNNTIIDCSEFNKTVLNDSRNSNRTKHLIENAEKENSSKGKFGKVQGKDFSETLLEIKSDSYRKNVIFPKKKSIGVQIETDKFEVSKVTVNNSESEDKKQEQLLFSFIYVSEAHYSEKAEKSYFTCRSFFQEDVFYSRLVSCSLNPNFNFQQVISAATLFFCLHLTF